MPEENVEETQEQLTEETPKAEESQTEEAPTVEVRLNELETRLNETSKAREDAEAKAKDLSARLTREQQEKAELYRFHKATLPKINKSFTDHWEESPEQAVDSKVEQYVQPVNQELAALKARTSMNTVLTRTPEMSKYEARVTELGDEHPELTYSQKGIERLFDMAQAEDLKKEVEKYRSNGKAEMEKSRAFTEGAAPKQHPKSKAQLNAYQRKIVEELGITEDDYRKRMEQGYGQKGA